MRYLITGSTGLLGQEIVNHLLKSDLNIRCLIHKNTVTFLNPKIEYVNGDISDLNSLTNICKNVDIIIHCAALINGTDKNKYIKINYLGTKNLVTLANKHSAIKFLYISSWATDISAGDYALSKRLAEQEVKKLDNFIILRPADIYANSKSHIHNYIKTLKKLPIIPIIGNGDYLISPLYIKDLLKVIFSKKIKLNRTFTITGPDIFSFNKFNKVVLDYFQIKKPAIHIPQLIMAPFITQERLKRLTTAKLVDKVFDFNRYNIEPLTLKTALNKGFFN